MKGGGRKLSDNSSCPGFHHFIISSSVGPLCTLNPASLDLVGDTLGNGVDGRGQVTADLEGQDRSVDDTDVGSTVDHQVGVDDTTHALGHHGGGTDGVEVGAGWSVLASLQ